jgi:zinc D-Ala-D-Ala carboxypeptidase
MDLTTKLSPNFTLGEMLRSATADGVKKRMPDVYEKQYNPPQIIIDALKALCENTLQPIVDYAKIKYPNNKVAMRVSSGYRSKWVNDSVGSNDNSQHPKGEAADTDLIIDGKERNDLYVGILIEMQEQGLLVFDQLILEYNTPLNPSWVHISYDLQGKQRGIVLFKAEGKPYVNYNKIFD